MTIEEQTVWPAVDPMGQAWMEGEVSATEWFDHVRAEAATSAYSDSERERSRALGSSAMTDQVES